MLTKAETYYLEKLKQWENELRSERPNKILQLCSDYINTGLTYLPEMQKQKILRSLDNILFHLHAILFNSTFQRNTAQKLMQQARVHNESIFTLKDMTKLNIDQLQSIADKQMAHYRMLASAQGALASKHTGFLIGDFLSILIINLRAVQVLASIYGRPAESPNEIMTALKVFCAGCLPKEQRLEAWNELMLEQVQEQQGFFYNGKEEIVQEKMLYTILTELIKLSLLVFFRGKSSYKGTIIGAAVNYHFTKKITEMAHHYYQKCYLLSKRDENLS
ncbi:MULTISPECIES: EcsC family protein [Niallia]|uniref:EcsC family protein n=1 Tax=Niallia alba TaxID=2729105 RepID=A0A7Y0PNW2_9BACI|nr:MULTISPECIES: EcsC family protein [Niallia]MBQ6449195.1 EcsC family protein [Bacillus sp. (in: firmicutes)]NMO78811.1 EcsC family protein [Niallia alba]UTI42083.1 EcsC family protein [Niallia sp. RD1]